MSEACSVCRRGEPPVCERCRHRLADQLAELPGLYDRLRLSLVPGPAGEGGGERVTATAGEAPMPARLAALTLEAGGSDDAHATFVPAVRVWQTFEYPDGWHEQAPPVIVWHREQVYDDTGRPVMTLADDQAGVLPIRAWLRAWAIAWRTGFGHHTGDRAAVKAHDPQPGEQRLTAGRLGIGPALRYTERPADPVEDEWRERWPADAAGWGPAATARHRYLATWLGEACDRLPHVEDFAASLRTLIGAAHAALGDVDDLEYLGRCPEEFTDAATGDTAVCGATLWHDPYASVITCPRCHAETGQDKRIFLARRILDAWPIDARRRYPRGLIDALRDVECPRCSAPMAVHWVDATERADRERFWRPVATTCPNGCDPAE